MHAITGCDTVSSFAGKGKLSAFQLVKKNVSVQELFARFGLSWEFSDVCKPHSVSALLMDPAVQKCAD